MKTYLINCYAGKKFKSPFIIDIVNADTPEEAENKTINKTYFKDSNKSKVLAVCKKAEVIHEIK
jgi:hypothetical protein